jgi:spore maturation protein CgeB
MPPAVFSVAEMATGYRDAFVRAGHDVREYRMSDRMAYHRRAVTTEQERQAWRSASETILVEAIYHRADLVLFVCPLSFHPVALELLKWGGFKVVALHTESPYQDEEQIAWNTHYPELHACTHERTTAARYGWTYLSHAYDPAVHRPGWSDESLACDVLFVGTGFPERISLLEAIDWTGITLRLQGVWDRLSNDSPLRQFYRPGFVDNTDLQHHYRSAKICLNPHRFHPDAVSLNPRAYELAATGVFQLTDARDDGSTFSRMLMRFSTADDLEAKIRHYLAHDDEREASIEVLRQLVESETFDVRVGTLMAAITPQFTDDYFGKLRLSKAHGILARSAANLLDQEFTRG